MPRSFVPYVIVILQLVGHQAFAQDSTTEKRSKAKIVADSIAHQQKNEVRSAVAQVKEDILSNKPTGDTIPKIQKPAFKKPKIDSVGVSYEDGKLNLPDNVPKDINDESLKKMAKDKLPANKGKELTKPGVRTPGVPSVPDKDDIKSIAEKRLAEKVVGAKGKVDDQKIKAKTDSVTQLIKKGEELLDGNPLLNAKRVYSNKALKKIYDSLGISKLDSVLAMASSKKDMSKEDLLDAINYAGPTAAPVTDVDGLKNAAKGEDLSELKDQLPVSDLGKVKLPDSLLRELPPTPGFQFPADKFKLLDSIRQANLSKRNLKLEQHDIKNNVEKIIAKRKPKFWDKAYFEGIVGYLKHKDSNIIQFAPSLGYHINPYFSIGLGPSIQAKETDKKWNIYVGYRTFLKAELFRQRAYLQVEDNVDPGGFTKEFLGSMNHSILTGGGVLIPISGKFSLNFAVLYRVNNEQYSGNSISPWVFRLGLSSVKTIKK